MYAYPVEVISDVYLSKIGGFSSELSKNEIGINAKAIEINTSIIPNETYAKLRFFDEKPYPYFLKRSYRVVGLEENMDGYGHSQNGEVVLSDDLKEEFENYLGKEVIINTVESFRIDYDYQKVIKAIFSYAGICLESRRRRN
jgi:hypothetical protein